MIYVRTASSGPTVGPNEEICFAFLFFFLLGLLRPPRNEKKKYIKRKRNETKFKRKPKFRHVSRRRKQHDGPLCFPIGGGARLLQPRWYQVCAYLQAVRTWCFRSSVTPPSYGEHWTNDTHCSDPTPSPPSCSSECPYNTEVPKNAIVGSGCDVFCKVCDYLFSERCCNQDSGRAKLKYCNLCSSYGEHWHVLCPRRSGEYVLNPPGHLTKYARRNKSGV